MFGAVLFVVATATAVLAYTEAPEPTTTEASEPSSGIVPAEEAPDVAEEEEEQPWTARFLAPTVLAIGAIATVATIVVYGLRVRARYEVVE